MCKNVADLKVVTGSTQKLLPVTHTQLKEWKGLDFAPRTMRRTGVLLAAGLTSAGLFLAYFIGVEVLYVTVAITLVAYGACEFGRYVDRLYAYERRQKLLRRAGYENILPCEVDIDRGFCKPYLLSIR